MNIVMCHACQEEHADTMVWRCEAIANGDIPCVDDAGHKWIVSDQDDEYAYCERCGCSEY